MQYREITNLDIFAVANELKALEGARLKKAYQSESEFRFKFSTKSGTKELLVLLPFSIHLTSSARSEGEPTSFAMLLRKHLENKVLTRVIQPSMDRLLVLDFSDRKLLIEMFGKGNVILVDEKDTIIAPARSEETRLRKIARGSQYVPLPITKILPADVDERKLNPSKKDETFLIAYLSRTVNMPAFYLEEVCHRAGIDPRKKLNECDGAVFSDIARAIRNLWTEINEARTFLYDDGTYSVVRLKKLEDSGIKAKTYTSYSSVLDEIHTRYSGEAKEGPAIKALGKIEKKLKHQEDHFAELKAEAEEMRNAGNGILMNEKMLTQLVERLKALREKKKSWEEIERDLKELTPNVKIEKGKLVLDL